MNPKMTMSPWPIVRWSAAALLYAATVVIAMDQIHERDAEVAAAETQVAAMKAGLKEIAEGNARMQTLNASVMEKALRVKSNLDQMTRGSIPMQRGALSQTTGEDADVLTEKLD